MILKKKKYKKSGSEQTDNIPLSNLDAVDDISFEEFDDSNQEIKTIEEFLEMKKRQNEVLKKLIENIDKSDNR